MNEDRGGYYLDTSALLPYYREEKTSLAIQNFLSSLRVPVGISDLTGLEFASALSRWVRMKEITDAQASLVENAFAEDTRSGLFRRLSITTKHYLQAHRSGFLPEKQLFAPSMPCTWHVASGQE